MSDLSNIVLLYAKPETSEALGRALTELVKQTRSEPGCAICELNQSAEDSTTWMVYERWRGQGAFDSHMKQPYVAHFLSLLDGLVSKPAEVRPFQHHS